MHRRIAFLIVPFLMAGLLYGCDRIGLFDMAKNGVDLVYSMGFSTTTMLDIARPGYHKQIDTMTSIVPTMIGAGGSTVFAVVGGTSVWTHSDGYSSWAALGGPNPPSNVYYLSDSNGEVLLLGDWSGAIYLCRLHEDSFQKADPFEDREDLTSLLGTYSPFFMFKAAGSESVYLITLDVSNSIKIFGISGGSITEILTNALTGPPSSINSAGKKGGYFYMLDAGQTLYKMSASTPNAQEFGPTGITSLAVTESGFYGFIASADGHFSKITDPTFMTTTEIRVFIGASDGEVLPFDGDGVAIRLSGGTEQGVWIYQDGDYKHIISGISNAMYVR
ncbi:MAG: hypothetical protein EPN93_09285 [Spirochaetes bacterium]|nr:MAG: hypothetical protein EPN93_09285 [Spirochaetota bacterium]